MPSQASCQGMYHSRSRPSRHNQAHLSGSRVLVCNAHRDDHQGWTWLGCAWLAPWGRCGREGSCQCQARPRESKQTDQSPKSSPGWWGWHDHRTGVTRELANVVPSLPGRHQRTSSWELGWSRHLASRRLERTCFSVPWFATAAAPFRKKILEQCAKCSRTLHRFRRPPCLRKACSFSTGPYG